ncbi:hypothetical protein J4Q44_G00283640 [Coregonus suidteri]|uniref:Rab-GAP TBC domain-containing protein n=1 Tax=Coregonus suidteri TaxID=861788 RepID=A0AAN8L647_9TELE
MCHQGAELGPKPDVTRGQPLDKWEEFLDPEGHVKDPQRIKELVFRWRGMLPYVQGMRDPLAPLLFVTQNEVESFWCLTGFMEMVHQNFEESQEAMKQQILQLSLLLKALDPELLDLPG